MAECTSISSELQRLIAQVDHPGTGESDEPNGLIVCPYPEDIIDLRNRLMGAQVKLSQIHNMQFAEDLGAIKKAVLEIVNSVTDSEDASSIRTFYTACSVPYVERSMWREVEQTLRTRFSPQCVQDHYALIIETIEASLSENLQQSEVTPTITSLFTPEQFQVIVREFVQKHVQLPISFEAIVERCIDITTLPKEMMTVTPPKRREKLFYFRVMEVATIRTIEFLQGVQPAYLHGLGLRSKSDREETLQSCRKRLAQIDALIGDDVLKMKVREKSVLPSNCQCIVSVTAECNFCRFPISLMYSKIIYRKEDCPVQFLQS